MNERESVKVLKEAIEVQIKKSQDYQNPNSKVRQADYYPNGVATLLDTCHAKVLRMQSVIDAMVNDENYEPNFESIEDSAIDLINYASFIVAYSRGKIDGQVPGRDFLNRPVANQLGKHQVDYSKGETLYEKMKEGSTFVNPDPDNIALLRSSDRTFDGMKAS